MSDTVRPNEFPPGPRGLPVLGSTPAAVRGGLDFTERMAREYGDVVHWEGARGHIYQFNHPEDIAHVLVANNENYVKGEGFQKVLGPLLGNGILNSEGEEWRHNRHLVQPSFHPDRIETYAGMMTDNTLSMLDSWDDGETYAIHDEMMELTLRIVCEALFGVDIERHIDAIGGAIDDSLSLTSSVANLVLPEGVPLPSRHRVAGARETFDGVVDAIIAEKRRDPGEDVVSALLAAGEDGEGLSDRQIRDEAVTLIAAGHETTAVSLTYTTFLLAQHPEIEAALVAELDDVLGGRPPMMADLPRLPVTERIVKESMRLYPPVPRIIREATEPDSVGGYEIPAGASVQMSQWVVHRDSRWYDDPLAFAPERWRDGLEKRLPNLAYFPFGAGPRRCVGSRFAMLEARLILAAVYQNFHLELRSDRSLDVIPTVTSRPKGEVRMRTNER